MKLTDEQAKSLKDEWEKPADLKIVVVPRELYYHEAAYVRGLEERVKTLEAALREIAAGLPASGSILEIVTTARAALGPEPKERKP